MNRQQIDLSRGESIKVGSHSIKLIGTNACEAIFEVEGPDGQAFVKTVGLNSEGTEAADEVHASV